MNNYVKALERILILEDRIKAIEKKQAERFPMLLERLDRLEKELAKLKKTEYFQSGTAVPVTKESAEGGSW